MNFKKIKGKYVLIRRSFYSIRGRGFLLATLFMLLFSSLSYAQKGIYISALGGWGSTNWSKIGIDPRAPSDDTVGLDTTLPTSTQDQGFAGGVALGWDFAKNFGVECRYLYFSRAKAKFDDLNSYVPPVGPGSPFTLKSQTQSVMLLVKLRAHLWRSFSVFSVLGGAYTMTHYQYPSFVITEKIGTGRNGFGGVFGAGLSQRFAKHFAQRLEFDFATGSAPVSMLTVKKYVPFLTTVTYQIAYYF